MKALIDILSYKEVITPKAEGRFLGNYKCHVNCLSYYKLYKGKVKNIVGCLQVFDDNETAAHFIVELKDGSFIDPTWGNMVELYSYCIPIEKYDQLSLVLTESYQTLKLISMVYYPGI